MYTPLESFFIEQVPPAAFMVAACCLANAVAIWLTKRLRRTTRR